MAGFGPPHICDLYRYGFSIPEVSAMTGYSRSTVRYHVKAASILRERSAGVQMAASEGRLGSGLRGKTRILSESHKANIKSAAILRGEKTAKGTTVKPSGYIEYTRGENKGRSVHRVTAELELGRRLSKREHVHHRDEDRSNNAPGNLEVLPIEEHMRLHALENYPNRVRNSDGTWR